MSSRFLPVFILPAPTNCHSVSEDGVFLVSADGGYRFYSDGKVRRCRHILVFCRLKFFFFPFFYGWGGEDLVLPLGNFGGTLALLRPFQIRVTTPPP